MQMRPDSPLVVEAVRQRRDLVNHLIAQNSLAFSKPLRPRARHAEWFGVYQRSQERQGGEDRGEEHDRASRLDR